MCCFRSTIVCLFVVCLVLQDRFCFHVFCFRCLVYISTVKRSFEIPCLSWFFVLLQLPSFSHSSAQKYFQYFIICYYYFFR